MTVYTNTNKDSAIASVESLPLPEGNMSFFYLSKNAFSSLNSGQNQENIRHWLSSVGQEIVNEAQIAGRSVLITRGAKSRDTLLLSLKERGESLQPPAIKAKMNPWVLRGNLSMVGQFLQLASGFLTVNRKKISESDNEAGKLPAGFKFDSASKIRDLSNYDKKGMDVPTMTFAVSNILANTSNIVFGAEKSTDEFQLRFLKESFNRKLSASLPKGEALPAVDQNRAVMRKEPPKPKTLGQKFYAFMQRHSVTIGEIGLRYFGAINLAFPVFKKGKDDKLNFDHLKKGGAELAEGSLKKGYETLANPDIGTRKAGLLYIFGKAIALFSTTPDPFNPKPRTALSWFREKVTFRLSTATEFVGAVMIAMDRFKESNT